MVFTYPCKSDWLQTIHPWAWRRGNESHEWLKLSESVSTRIDQESEHWCSRQAVRRALMELFKRAYGVSAGKYEWKGRESQSPLHQTERRPPVNASQPNTTSKRSSSRYPEPS